MTSELIDPATLPTMSFDWGDQMVDDRETFPVRQGQAVFIPKGAFHSTVNTGWEPMTLLAIYAPAGAEAALKGLPDYREVPPGEAPRLERAP
jgi:oxalate decarboxylase/phosphoglucose isomerase-like protein (cupin superfamily)